MKAQCLQSQRARPVGHQRRQHLQAKQQQQQQQQQQQHSSSSRVPLRWLCATTQAKAGVLCSSHDSFECSQSSVQEGRRRAVGVLQQGIQGTFPRLSWQPWWLTTSTSQSRNRRSGGRGWTRPSYDVAKLLQGELRQPAHHKQCAHGVDGAGGVHCLGKIAQEQRSRCFGKAVAGSTSRGNSCRKWNLSFGNLGSRQSNEVSQSRGDCASFGPVYRESYLESHYSLFRKWDFLMELENFAQRGGQRAV